MPLTIKHSFTSPKLDGPDPTVVRPSNWNDPHTITGAGIMLAGQIIDFAGVSWPAQFLACYGQSVSAATYPLLFAAMVNQHAVTFTVGSPGSVNWLDHDIPPYGKVRFRGGTLPGGITADTDYYVVPVVGFTVNSFRISATPDDAAISLSGSPIGPHTGIHAPYGVATDLSTFSIPDLRGRVVAGSDVMGGADAARLAAGLGGGVVGKVLGAGGGVDARLMTVAQLPAHTHSINPPSVPLAGGVTSSNNAHQHISTFGVRSDIAGGGTRKVLVPADGTPTSSTNIQSDVQAAHTHTVSGAVDIGTINTDAAGLGELYNNVQPTLILRKLIFTG